MHLYPDNLMKKAGINTPLIGFYDSPDVSHFEPLVRPGSGRQCIFAYYKSWQKGKTLHITKDNFGCGGTGNHLFNIKTRSRKEFINFLVDDEGLKSSHDLMSQWLDKKKSYEPEHGNILIGPLQENQYQYLKSITFYVNPDQLGLLMLAAHYNRASEDFAPVLAPFGSGCMQLVTLFDELNIPQAVISATDIAMRQYLPPDIIGFTVTKPLYEEICMLDEKSFLSKPFWQKLAKARKGFLNK